ncbi:MAG: T9SS type A sorting domain-containing protein [Flavobacteriaceae bacterium]
MTVKSISTLKNIRIETENDSNYTIEIRTYLGTTIFKDTILPKNKIISIKGLNPGKYIIHISNELKLIKRQINI